MSNELNELEEALRERAKCGIMRFVTVEQMARESADAIAELRGLIRTHEACLTKRLDELATARAENELLRAESKQFLDRTEKAEAEVEQLEGDVTDLENEMTLLRRRNEELAELGAKSQKLRVALGFYADPANWTEPEQVNRQELFDTPMGDDLGAKARAALTPEMEENNH